MSGIRSVWFERVGGSGKALDVDFPTDADLTVEIHQGSGFDSVDPLVFRSWSGRRRMDGDEWSGRLWYWLSNTLTEHQTVSVAERLTRLDADYASIQREAVSVAHWTRLASENRHGAADQAVLHSRRLQVHAEQARSRGMAESAIRDAMAGKPVRA